MSYQDYQRLFSNYCREVDGADLPEGVCRSDRIEVYRRLVFGGVNEALKKAYPITFRLLGEKVWRSLVKELFREVALESPLLWQMPKALLDYMRPEHALCIKYPFLGDLLSFEWYEIKVYMMPDADLPEIKVEGDIWADSIIVNPERLVLELSYPVFSSSIEELREVAPVVGKKSEYNLLMYRQPDVFKVKFIELTTFYVDLLLAIENYEGILNQAIEVCLTPYNQVATEDFKLEVSQFIQVMLEQKLILGFDSITNQA